jgi:3'(2'),5'-bisphosphate nucleotidase
MQNISPNAEEIIKIAQGAGDILMKYFKTDLKIEFKKDENDHVTIADREADTYIRESLEKHFPDDLILSEEHATLPQYYEGRVWMVDPLDGTKYFIKGGNNFSVLIGLVENGEPIIGCIYLPAQSKIFYAEKGKGAYRSINGDNFEKIKTTDIENIEDSRLISRFGAENVRPIEEKTNQIKFKEKIQAGALGIKLTMVAEGAAEAHFDTSFKPCKWDAAGGELIVREAGGVVTDFDGANLDYKGENVCFQRSIVVSANPALHTKIISEFKKLEI